MSVVSDRVITTKKGQLMSKMCVFCETVYSAGVMVCQECQDYKGLMALDTAIEYLNLDPNDYL